MNSLEGDSEFPGDGGSGAASCPGGGQDPSEAVQGHSIGEDAEAQVQAILGDLESSKSKYLRREVNSLASPGQARRDLTISSLIAECEEYVKTDEFTKDFSDNLLHLFSQNKTSSQPECHVVKNSLKPENLSKPPKIPESMRSSVKTTSKPDKNEYQQHSPKFPVHPTRSSTYDNVHYEVEVEDEGIGNDFDDNEDSVNSRTPPSAPNSCLSGLCDKHESSPALTSEGYDSAHESGDV